MRARSALRTPWDNWIKIGLGHIGLTSRDFWSLSLREWTLTMDGYRERIGASNDPGMMSREDLDALMERYPDVPRNAS